MVSVYTCCYLNCAEKDDSTDRRRRNSSPGKYENSALSGEDLKPAKMPLVREVVGGFLADTEER